jgi:hypothetical protein
MRKTGFIALQPGDLACGSRTDHSWNIASALTPETSRKLTEWHFRFDVQAAPQSGDS